MLLLKGVAQVSLSADDPVADSVTREETVRESGSGEEAVNRESISIAPGGVERGVRV